MVLNHNIYQHAHTCGLLSLAITKKQAHVVIMASNHTVLIDVHTHMKDTNQAGTDYRSWLGFNIRYEVQTQHHTNNRVSAMPARTSPYK